MVGNMLSNTLFRSYQQKPDQVAIHFLQTNQPDKEISFRDLFLGAAGYAQAFSRMGILPGEVVVLILQHSEALIFAFWGAILHGAVPSIMPFQTEKLSPDHYRESISALFGITQPAAVVTSPDSLADVKAAAKSASPIPAVLLTEEIQPATLIDPDNFSGLFRSPEEIVLLQHSSGTTGLQKGVALSHLAVNNQLRSYTEALHLKGDDVIVSWLPLYHDMGLIAGFILPVLCQVPLVLMSPFDWVRAPFRLFNAITRYKGTLVWMPNFAFNFCAQKIRDQDLESVDLTCVRAIINCSEPTYLKSHQLFSQRFSPYGLRPEALATCYAMAENVFAVTQSGIDSPITVDSINKNALLSDHIALPSKTSESSFPMLSSGKPIANTQVRVLDDRRNELPERHVGEIAILSDCMLTGYFNRPDLTSQAFFDSWYLTGDLGYISDGEVFVIGRKKEMIIVGGKNIYPQDLEHLASEVPGVHPGRVVAFGIFNEASGTEDVVVVAEMNPPKNGTDWEQEATRVANQVRATVTRGSDITLRHVQIVQKGWLLKTSSGKIARQANREKYLLDLNGS
jgi:fatty-acyl-CoA synthase